MDTPWLGRRWQDGVPLLTERMAKNSNYSGLLQILPHDSGYPAEPGHHAGHNDAASAVDF